ncbi:reverse transcriptase [Plakobranchus ocellatus]|uniref:Reverse transcriptase n=1 Tax=Plakobranchus ocellatus TaxID=259542 RepID=A0AAV3Z574_9GAST|nr:reverse transcriptase [Plakobranchus ocellatus]
MEEANPNTASGMDNKHKTLHADDDDRWKGIKDCGYAWMIALASFFAFAICGGFAACDGIFYVMFMARYKSSARLTAWLGAIASTLHAFSAIEVILRAEEVGASAAYLCGGYYMPPLKAFMNDTAIRRMLVRLDALMNWSRMSFKMKTSRSMFTRKGS